MPGSALIVPVDLPPALDRVRQRHDPSAARGVPPHVTILYPFMPADRLTHDVQSDLDDVVRATPSFRCRFVDVDRRDGMVWLLPFDEEPFLRLTTAIVERWPDLPPYRGVHHELVAHLTLVERDDARSLDECALTASTVVPFEIFVDALHLIVEKGNGRWERRWRFPFGSSR